MLHFLGKSLISGKLKAPAGGTAKGLWNETEHYRNMHYRILLTVRKLVGVQETVLLVSRAFVPPKRGGF